MMPKTNIQWNLLMLVIALVIFLLGSAFNLGTRLSVAGHALMGSAALVGFWRYFLPGWNKHHKQLMIQALKVVMDTLWYWVLFVGFLLILWR